MGIKEKALVEILEYLKSKGHSLDNYVLKWDNEKKFILFILKKK